MQTTNHKFTCTSSSHAVMVFRLIT